VSSRRLTMAERASLTMSALSLVVSLPAAYFGWMSYQFSTAGLSIIMTEMADLYVVRRGVAAKFKYGIVNNSDRAVVVTDLNHLSLVSDPRDGNATSLIWVNGQKWDRAPFQIPARNTAVVEAVDIRTSRQPGWQARMQKIVGDYDSLALSDPRSYQPVFRYFENTSWISDMLGTGFEFNGKKSISVDRAVISEVYNAECNQSYIGLPFLCGQLEITTSDGHSKKSFPYGVGYMPHNDLSPNAGN